MQKNTRYMFAARAEQSRENYFGARLFDQKLQKLHMKRLLMHSMI